MKKMIALLMLSGAALSSTSLYAAEMGEGSMGFWEKLRRRVELIAPHKNVAATTAVGGVRGAQVTADDTYWKGEKTVKEVAPEELVAFQKAVALVQAGEVKQAQTAFNDFVKNNPDSILREDAESALIQLQSN